MSFSYLPNSHSLNVIKGNILLLLKLLLLIVYENISDKDTCNQCDNDKKLKEDVAEVFHPSFQWGDLPLLQVTDLSVLRTSTKLQNLFQVQPTFKFQSTVFHITLMQSFCKYLLSLCLVIIMFSCYWQPCTTTTILHTLDQQSRTPILLLLGVLVLLIVVLCSVVVSRPVSLAPLTTHCPTPILCCAYAPLVHIPTNQPTNPKNQPTNPTKPNKWQV